MFWINIKYESEFLEEKENISDLSKWRLQHFITNVAQIENPLDRWKHTTCPNHNDFHLIGLNDDGLGNKRLEILLQLDRENRLLNFCMVTEINS